MRDRAARSTRAVSAGLAVALAVPGCAVARTSGSASPDTVTMAINSDYNSLDPAKMNSAAAYSLAMTLYDRLVVQDSEGRFLPGLARRWRVTSTSVAFTLRRGVTCSDGTPVRATTVKQVIDHLADPRTASPNRARTFGSGDVTVTADDAKGTVTVHNSKPFNDMLVGLSSPWAGIFCGSGLRAPEGVDGAAAPGTGAWTLDEKASIRRAQYVFERRADYRWAPAGVATDDLPKRLVVRVITDQSAVANELTTGGLDIGFPGLPNVRRLDQLDGLERTRRPTYGSYFMYFRQERGSPFAAEEMRKALTHAVDRKEAVAVATASLGRPGPSYLTSSVACTDGVSASVPDFDPAKAARELRALGYRRDANRLWAKDGRPVTIRLIAEPVNYPAGNEYVQDRLSDFGFRTRLQERPTPEVLEQLGTSDSWDIAIFPYGPPINTPNSAASFLESRSPSNWSGIDNPTFDAGVAEGIARDLDDPRRCAAWRRGQRSLVAHADIVPLWGADAYWFSSRKLDVRNLRSLSGSSVDPTSLRMTR